MRPRRERGALVLLAEARAMVSVSNVGIRPPMVGADVADGADGRPLRQGEPGGRDEGRPVR